MAKVNFTVEEAKKAMWGPTGEAQALLELHRTASCDESVALLAVSILRRYVAAWELLSTELYRHGHPRLLPRAPASGDVES